MTITEEYSIDIRVTSEQGKNDYGYPTERYGCDIINTDGELLVGIEPEYKPLCRRQKGAHLSDKRQPQKRCLILSRYPNNEESK